MDHIKFSSILTSQLLHDLAGPLGVIDNTLDLIDIEGQNNLEKDEYKFASEAAKQAIIKLKFFRTVFSASIIDKVTDDVVNVISNFLKIKKIKLSWVVSNSKNEINSDVFKLIASFLYGVNSLIPFGGEVHVSHHDSTSLFFKIKIKGQKIARSDKILYALNGQLTEVLNEKKLMPFICSSYYTKKLGITIISSLSDEEIIYETTV